ncbi:MAG: peptidase M19 [Stenotrophobium sp.]
MVRFRGMGLGVAMLATLAGCGQSSSVSVDNGGTSTTGPVGESIAAPVAVPQTRYDMANGCYALKSVAANAYAVHGKDGSYAATGRTDKDGEPLYLKPTALGKYICYATDKSMLAASGSNVNSVTAPSDAADWTIDSTAPGQYTLLNQTSGKSLATDANGKLVLSDTPGTFNFVATSGCTPYPEMPVDISGPPYRGRGVDKPVIGFADGHTHMAMSSELSDGSQHLGPSAGGVLYGQMFNRFGVTEALKDCEAFHGPLGIKDAQFIVEGGAPAPHETKGWPTFAGWPKIPNITHQAMYYRWVERAYLSGLRLLVDLGTNIQALCSVGVTAGLGQPGADCNDMSLGIKQIQYSYEMQDYIDAQEGGPGKGWFRIVTTPSEARKVINDGKMAVVLGLEFSNLFDCDVHFLPGGSETDGCTKADIDAGMQKVYAMGVRQIYLYHDVNSALGGTGIFNTLSLNLIGFWGTQGFWKTYDCPAVPYYDAPGNYNAGAVMTTALPGTGSDPVTQLLFSATGGTLPVYPPGRQCNARGMTELGHYALQEAMKYHFILDTDHAELSEKQNMIDLAKQQTPPYPLISMHGGHGGLSLQMAKDILDLGGIIFPYDPNGVGWMDAYKSLKKIWPADRPIAMGYGFDGNGFGGQPGPRGAGHPQIQYPFTLFQGPGWGPQFAAAGIKPVTVDMLTIPESGKSWNADVDGTAHYGMVADLVEEIREEGGEDAINAFFNSAEAYIEMWEKVDNR